MTSLETRQTRSRFQATWLVWFVGSLLVLTLASKGGDMFAGRMPGTDDLLRLQQVRDLLAGQSWFNVDQSRFLTPEGGAMHWSRLPDLFLSILISLFKPFLGGTNAEILAVIVWPLILLSVALSAMVIAMRRLGFQIMGQVFALCLFSMSGAVYNFWPGRIDHHGFVVTLCLVAFAALLSPQRTLRSSLIMALAITAILSIAVEGLPYIGVLIALLGVFWIVRGHLEAPRLTVFGLALAGFGTLFYLFDAPGASGQRAVCDAYGQAHYAGFLGGGLLLAGIGVFGGNLDTWQKRLSIGVIAGALTLGLIIAAQPECLGDPYANVSEQVKLAWLSGVGEARTLLNVFEGDPYKAVWYTGFMLSGLVCCFIQLAQKKANDRLALIALTALMLMALLATVWQFRGTTFSHLFASMACGGALGLLVEAWWRRRGPVWALALCAGVFAASPMGWRIMATPFPGVDRGDAPAATATSNMTCTDPAAFMALPQTGQLRIFTPIDLGVPVLTRTPHAIFAAPYHRNVKGIERVTDVFMSSPETALLKMRAMGANHFLYCKGMNEARRYMRLNPDGFAAYLENGNMPDWLEPADNIEATEGVVRLYRIKE